MNVRLLFLLILIAAGAKAQESIPELITDRPDQTESAEVVPLNALQIETGFVVFNDKANRVQHTSYAYNSTLLRYGILPNFELRLGLEYLGNKTDISSNSISGFGPLYTGFKVKISDEQKGMPAIAILGALTLPFTANEEYKPSEPAANMRLSISHTLSDRISMGYNLGAEWDGETPTPGYFYSIALGIGISDKVGLFAESFGLLGANDKEEHLLDAGVTYLLLPNLQVDISGGIGLSENAADSFVGAGLSFRLPQ